MKKTTIINCVLILTFVFSLITLKGYAQEVKIYELFENVQPNPVAKAGKTVLSSKTAVNTSYSEDLKSFYELNYKLKPTVYIQNNSIVQVPANKDAIKVQLEDTKSFNILKSNNPNFETVELIVVNVASIAELNNSFDVSSLQGFNSLKYIYVQCNQFKTSVNQIQNFVINAGTSVTVYFMTTNPS